MKKLLLEITIPEYITRVALSESRRAVYYSTKGKRKPPKSLLKNPQYVVDKKGFLRNRVTGDKVVANKKVVGTPKFQKINGQDFYSGFGSHHIRMKIVAGIKNFMRPFIRQIPPIAEYPVQFEMDLYNVIGEGNWDLDNLWIYTKCFQDLLVEEGIMPDDNIQFVTKPAAPEFFPIADESERKLVFRIYKDERNVRITEPVRGKK
jgi:hypothetical protein